MNYEGYIKLQDMDLQECYDSPLDIITQMANQLMADMENGVVKAVNNVGINIDKEKLAQALQQDRARYEEAYRRGYMKAVAREAHLLSLHQVMCELEGEPAWLEYKNKPGIVAVVREPFGEDDAFVRMYSAYATEVEPAGLYGETWRLWSARPRNGREKTFPWEEAEE